MDELRYLIVEKSKSHMTSSNISDITFFFYPFLFPSFSYSPLLFYHSLRYAAIQKFQNYYESFNDHCETSIRNIRNFQVIYHKRLIKTTFGSALDFRVVWSWSALPMTLCCTKLNWRVNNRDYVMLLMIMSSRSLLIIKII